MRTTLALTLGALLLAAPAFSQVVASPTKPDPSAAPTDLPNQGRASRSPGAPVDLGPGTPQSDRAFRGGGVVLEGAPGAPAPAPQAIPPGTRGGIVVQVPGGKPVN